MTHKKPQLAIVATEFHKELMEAMITAATDEATKNQAEITTLVRVAGSYEAPLIAANLLKQQRLDGVVVLGYIERGETLHGEVMGHVVHTALMNLQLTTGKPIGIGIIGPGATPAQAEVRKLSAARSAVQATLQSWQVLQDL